MMKRIVNSLLVIMMVLNLTGCSKKQEAVEETPEPTPTATPTPTPDPYAAPAGTYFSETTGMPISTDLKEQRPIAVMVDCETIALPHYGLAEADIVYDMINNVMNNRITRFMAIYKDYNSVPQIGSIRSTRTTNIWLAGEWNAILVHDGQAMYATQYYSEPYASQHLSSGFARIDNGKPSEFTEYVTTGEVEERIQEAGFDHDYNQYKPEGEHFNFVKYNTTLDTSSFNNATYVQEPFPHNATTLAFNTDTKTYDLSMYGELHRDVEDGQVLSFTNLLLLDASFEEYPSGGYVYYNIVGTGGFGYYLTNGKIEPITWSKGAGETDITHYYDTNDKELQIARGKTYISYIPADAWAELAIQ